MFLFSAIGAGGGRRAAGRPRTVMTGDCRRAGHRSCEFHPNVADVLQFHGRGADSDATDARWRPGATQWRRPRRPACGRAQAYEIGAQDPSGTVRDEVSAGYAHTVESMDYKLNDWLDRRKSPRMPRATLGRRLAVDLNGVELQVIDVSDGGMRLGCEPARGDALKAALATGDCTLTLRLPNQPVVALRVSVRYSNADANEIALGVQIDPREVDSPAWAAYRKALQAPVMKIAT